MPAGNILYGQAAITHCPVGKKDSGRNLRIYRAMLAQGMALGPREQYYYGRELYDHGLYGDAAQAFSTYLERSDGWAVDQVGACRLLAGCYEKAGQTVERLGVLLQALRYAVPDAGLCCDLGRCFLDAQQYRQAIWWYEQALRAVPDPYSGRFFATRRIQVIFRPCSYVYAMIGLARQKSCSSITSRPRSIIPSRAQWRTTDSIFSSRKLGGIGPASSKRAELAEMYISQ